MGRGEGWEMACWCDEATSTERPVESVASAPLASLDESVR